jgi:hypothetical protein
MECMIEFKDLSTKLKFLCSKYKQKLIVDILIRHNQIQLKDLAALIGISTTLLTNVYTGDTFLDGKAAANLNYLLFIFLNE